MSAEPSSDLQRANDATGLRSSDDAVDTRASVERLDEVVMSESTGTVGLIFIEQKDGIVVLMCVRLPLHIPSSCIFLHRAFSFALCQNIALLQMSS